jgi:lysophospholipase L1-like esterase
MNCGRAGDPSASALSKFDKHIQLAPDIVFIAVGTNDIGSMTAGSVAATVAAATFANIEAMCKQAKSIGAKILLSNIRPRADFPIGSNKFNAKVALNTLISDYCANGNATLVDMHAAYADGTGMPIAGAFYDGIHPSVIGAQKYGAPALVASLKKVTKSLQKQTFSGANRVVNFGLTGTGGSNGANVTGDPGLNWGASTTGPAVVTSIVNGKRQYAITPSGTGEKFLTVSMDSGINVPVVAGEWVRAKIELRLSQWAGWNLPEFKFFGNTGGGVTAMNYEGGSKIDTSTGELVISLITPPYKVPPGATAMYATLRLWFDAGVAGSPIVTIDSITAGSCGDAIAAHGGYVNNEV